MTEKETCVLFVHPEIRTQDPPQHPPLGIAQLAAITETYGYKTGIIDNNAARLQLDALREEVKSEKVTWSIIGIGGLITQYKSINPITKMLRKEYPDAIIVGGGGFMSSMPREMLKWIPEMNLGVIGEAYITWQEILEHKDDQDWATIKGVVYREGQKIKLTPKRPLIPEAKLDGEIPFPAYHLLPIEIYLANSAIAYAPEFMPQMTPNGFYSPRRLDVCTSYGCVYNCYFCFHTACPTRLYGEKLSEKPFRQHSPEYVIGLLLHLRKHYCIDRVSFIDENMTVNPKWFMEFCRKLEESDLATLIKWGMLAHPRTVTPELLAKAHDTGCVYISFGGESSSEHLLKEMGKGQTKEIMTSALEMTHSANINPIMTFMVGLPNMTIDDLIGDLQYFLDNQIHGIPFFTQPYPGTQLYEQFKDKIIEQWMTPEERVFIKDPTAINLRLAKIPVQVENDQHLSDAWVRKNADVINGKIHEAALERWVLSLDDALRFSVNLTDFNDIELAGLRYFLSTNMIDLRDKIKDLERLKEFKKMKTCQVK